MLYMALAHSRFTNSTRIISSHYSIFKQWTEYLVNSTLYPILQASTGALPTNLWPIAQSLG